MSPSVIYWTSSMHPEMEAISKEVAMLRDEFPKSITLGITSQKGLQLSFKNGFGFSPKLFRPFQVGVWITQRFFDINHLVGQPNHWYHLKALNTGRNVMTIAAEGQLPERKYLKKIDRFAVEWGEARDSLIQAGVNPCHIQVIPPSVDFSFFQQDQAPTTDPFTVLFASSPSEAAWLEGRGVNLLLETAKRLPDVRFRLLWRPWGDGFQLVRETLKKGNFTNVDLAHGVSTDMANEYRRAHLTIAPFIDPAICKPVPNSLIESLASSRPIVMTNRVKLANDLGDCIAHQITQPTADSLSLAIQKLRAEWKPASLQAFKVATERYAPEVFLESYRRLYEQVLILPTN